MSVEVLSSSSTGCTTAGGEDLTPEREKKGRVDIPFLFGEKKNLSWLPEGLSVLTFIYGFIAFLVNNPEI